MLKPTFDMLLARELAGAFSASADLGCVVKTVDSPQPLCSFGYTSDQCALCGALGCDRAACADTHMYGMAQAQRFGGRYIYFCKRGLTFFVSPIIGSQEVEARVTVGPFLMVDAEDFCACEMGEQRELLPLIQEIPFVQAERATQLSSLLYMAVGYLNSVSSVEAMREKSASDALQGQISAYILEIKQAGQTAQYPYDKEQRLFEAMRAGKRDQAQGLLHEILGHILVRCGADVQQAKPYLISLLVMMTRTVIQDVSDADYIEKKAVEYYRELQLSDDLPHLCAFISGVMHELMDCMFSYQDSHHADALHRATQYIRTHLDSKLDLETLAKAAYLSPAYFSRIFREETGVSVQQAIMDARLQRATELIRYGHLKLSEIAQMVGFQDQSYFSRAFQKAYGLTPTQYRRKLIK